MPARFTIPTSFLTRTLVAASCVAALGASAAGCGGDSGDEEAADAALAEQIAASAAEKRRQREELAQQTTERQTTTFTGEAPQPRPTSSVQDDLPAGTEELEGDGDAGRTSGSSTSGLLSAADRRSFNQLARTLPGAEGVAVATLGPSPRVARAGSLRAGVAWSTAKVPVAMAAIRAGVGTRSDLTAAITASDNAAAERLWGALGGGATAARKSTQQVRAAGDNRTVIQGQKLRAGYTAFGQTDWALTDQARFMAGMGCTAAGPEVLRLMGQVVPGQRWGLGTTGSGAQFKGGWGPGIEPGAGGGWLDRQMGIVRVEGTPIAVAIGTSAGDHGTGTKTLTTLARWVVEHVSVKGAPKQARC